MAGLSCLVMLCTLTLQLGTCPLQPQMGAHTPGKGSNETRTPLPVVLTVGIELDSTHEISQQAELRQGSVGVLATVGVCPMEMPGQGHHLACASHLPSGRTSQTTDVVRTDFGK